MVRQRLHQGWYFTCGSTNTGVSASKPPTYATHDVTRVNVKLYKAPWGLLVLAWTDGIFTANALSPSPSPRQCPHDYSIRAGQNLPDKEFRYLRTVIVTAAID